MQNIVVIDLNVFVRALLGSGIDRIIYSAIKEEKITPVFSPDLLENLAKVLFRPHLRLRETDIKKSLETIKAKAIIVEPRLKITACRDASDNILLETAAASKACAIITHDPDLLILNPFQGIPVVDSRQFLKLLKKR